MGQPFQDCRVTGKGIMKIPPCVIGIDTVPRSSSSSRDKVPSPTQTRRPSTNGHPPEHPPSAERALSTEGSFIPGETEEDGMLRREYVLVGDTRAVEFNRAIDGTFFHCLSLCHAVKLKLA